MPTRSSEIPGQAPTLTDRRPVPTIGSEQLRRFNKDTLHIKPVGLFNPAWARGVIEANEGRPVIGVDLGGGKATAILFTPTNGILVPYREGQIIIPNNGDAAGFMPMLQDVGRDAKEKGIPIGVSSAGEVVGSRLIQSPNMKAFVNRLHSEYDGDFTRLLPTASAVNNDAEAAIKTAILEGAIRGLIPNTEGKILAMEPGHVQLINNMNPLGQKTPDEACGMYGQQFVCVERAIGGAAGVESRWLKTTGQKFDGRVISRLYQEGNPLATQLYDSSATLLATAIQGMGETLHLTGNQAQSGLLLPIVGGGFGSAAFMIDSPRNENKQSLTVAFHGGVNNVPGYMDRTAQILKQAHTPINGFFTEDFSLNAGAEGAAIAALMALAA